MPHEQTAFNQVMIGPSGSQTVSLAQKRRLIEQFYPKTGDGRTLSTGKHAAHPSVAALAFPERSGHVKKRSTKSHQFARLTLSAPILEDTTIVNLMEASVGPLSLCGY